MERKLATIAKIESIHSIEGADNLEMAIIRGWQVVVKKGEFKPEYLCVYVEIDSVMPERPEFEFLQPRNYRIKTVKLRGQVSQGIAFPINILKSVGTIVPWPSFKPGVPPLLMHPPKENEEGKLIGTGFTKIVEGEDVTEILGIEKYDPPIPACLGGVAIGKFFSHSIKTDEERIQNLTKIYEDYRTKYTWTATEKLDGTSCTFTVYENTFGVASRNLRLKEHPENELNSFWKFARENDIEEKMRNFMEKTGMEALTFQGELIGEGIQKNKYKLKGQDVRFFRVFDPIKYTFIPALQSIDAIHGMGLRFVPVIETDMTLPDTVKELLDFADGVSLLYDTAREGVVFVAETLIDPTADLSRYQGRLSFKVISNKFLLKHGE